MSKEQIKVVITSAVVIGGRLVVPGREVSLPKKDAMGLLRRGKAVIGVKDPPPEEAEEVLDAQEDPAEENAAPQVEVPDREALEREYIALGGRPRDEWPLEELLRRLEERRKG